MAELYLFDGYNLLHAGPFADARELVDALASYVAVRGARGVVVFDGVGEDAIRGPLEVRFAAHADSLLERLAAEHRDTSRVLLVTSDATVAAATGGQRGEAVLVRPSSGTSGRRSTATSAPRAWPGSSTRRRAPAWNASAEASNRVPCNWGLCSLQVLARFTSTSG